jgi:hypothetical protein
VVNHDTVDFARDTASAIVGGIVLMGIGGVLAYFRHVRARLERHANEIRHTQNETNVKPFYPEYPADKL